MGLLPEPHLFAVDKPKGITSYDVIRKFKKILKRPFGKIGHLGTLDPFASGLLFIGISGATRFSDLIHDRTNKTYLASGLVGVKTDSGDETGNIVLEQEGKIDIEVEELSRLWGEKFKGDYFQVPPAYSATKHEGKKLYEYAREGIVIEKKAVRRRIEKIQLFDLKDEVVTFEVTVSKGTYIRTLFEDMLK